MTTNEQVLTGERADILDFLANAGHADIIRETIDGQKTMG